MRLSRDGFSVDAAIAKGRELPEWYLDAPELPPGAEIFFEHFYDLTTCRSFSQGPGPIPWLAIAQYAEHWGYAGAARDVLFRVIRDMDNAYLEWSNKEVERQKRNAEK